MNRLKKAIALMLAASSLAACAVSGSAADSLGDVDENGVIDANDALMALQYSVGMIDLSRSQLSLADLNNDGGVDSDDALRILRKSIGIDDSLETNTVTVLNPSSYKTRTQVSEMKGWDPQDVINKVGPLFTADQEETGVLASVSLAQFIIESGYGQSKLSIEANNCFGMKGSLSGNSWESSYWDGYSLYTINTNEQKSDGTVYTISADFRKYDCMEDSIGDHSQYLLSSMNGSRLRYEGLQGCTDYRRAAQIIKDGGYATAVNYVDVICSVIERWNLTQYDVQNGGQSTTYSVTQPEPAEQTTLYRVRSSWDNSQSQVGAYRIYENAVACADSHPGYSVYDENGNAVYTSYAW